MPERAPAGTLLAFDFGLRRIGVAVGQTATRTASPLATIRTSGKPDWASIDGLVDEWRPGALVVGLPLDAAGNETDMSHKARRFGRELESRYGLTVYFMDERLTSRAAEAEFSARREAGHARRSHARKMDAMAAKIILENWLQSQPVVAAP